MYYSSCDMDPTTVQNLVGLYQSCKEKGQAVHLHIWTDGRASHDEYFSLFRHPNSCDAMQQCCHAEGCHARGICKFCPPGGQSDAVNQEKENVVKKGLVKVEIKLFTLVQNTLFCII